MSFRQFAQDHFTVAVKGPNHCGPNHDSPKQFKFEVELLWPTDSLDAQGFLVDNLSFKAYFDSILETELSCELLVRQAAKDLYRLTGGRAEKCRVAIWAIPDHVMVEFDCGPDTWA